MRRPLKIALIQYGDARNVREWSGTTYFSKQAIDRHVGDVVDLTPVPFSTAPYRAAARLLSAVTRRRHAFNQDPLFSRRVGAYFSRKLAEGEYDLAYSPAGSATLAYLRSPVPTIYYSDATWRVVQNYYDCYSDAGTRTAAGGEELERRALSNVSLALFSSDWARGSAVNDYGVPEERARTVYIGANLPNPPDDTIARARELGRTIRLLMVGVSWEIKGGAVALETLIRLLERGVDAELTVVGCSAPEGTAHPRMRVIPFLDKRVDAERELFESLWGDATFFLLPTRFEAAGVVFCEAGAYGLPSLATHTGGVTSLIREGLNGYTLPEGASGADYADRIVEIAADPIRYRELCAGSRREYETRLNWDVWGKRVAEAVEELFPNFRGRTKG